MEADFAQCKQDSIDDVHGQEGDDDFEQRGLTSIDREIHIDRVERCNIYGRMLWRKRSGTG